MSTSKTEQSGLPRVALGNTGLRVSVAGLGCGGFSRLGTSQDKGEDHAVRIVRSALDLGVNFIDTAENYQTEPYVGRAIAGVPRESVVISSKLKLGRDGRKTRPTDVAGALEESLKKLGTDYIDIYHLHGLSPEDYPDLADALLPELDKAKRAGKIRFTAISEMFHSDVGHAMLRPAVAERDIDVVMVGFNLLNPSARHSVLPTTQRRGIGTLAMFAVRTAMSRPERLREIVGELIDSGQVNPDAVDRDNPLGFLDEHAISPTEAGYRFCAHEPGIDVVLFGTGSEDHLRANVAALSQPPLPQDVQAKLRTIFGEVDSVSGQ